MNIKKIWNKKIGNFHPDFVELSRRYHRPVWFFYADALWNKLRNGIGPVVYFSWAMYRMNQRERSQFVSERDRKKFEKIFNSNPQKNNIISSKPDFNRIFAQWVKREWIYVPDRTDDQIRAFLERNAMLIIKPPDKTQGMGVRKAEARELLDDFDAFIREAREGAYLMEALIRQHPVMAGINPSSVNTLRVNTVRDSSGQVHVIAASLRVGGADQVVDNFSAGGVQYPVDPKTGIIIGGGVMHDGTRDVYFHPSTNCQVLGLNIPNWDTVLDTVKNAAALPENIRYVGWDIAITEDGCDMVEGNINQGVNGMQLDGVGKRRQIIRCK